MAYVVTRPKGRFEIRESVHTPKGPRARSLANYARFSDEVLERARKRASRPFDADAVRIAAERAMAGPRVAAQEAAAQREAIGLATEAEASATVPRHAQPEARQFLEASRRMVRSLERLPEKADRRDPGDALLGLFDLVALSAASQPPRPPEPLCYPLLAHLRAARS